MADFLLCPCCSEDVEVENVWRTASVTCGHCKTTLNVETDTVDGENGKEEMHWLERRP